MIIKKKKNKLNKILKINLFKINYFIKYILISIKKKIIYASKNIFKIKKINHDSSFFIFLPLLVIMFRYYIYINF